MVAVAGDRLLSTAEHQRIADAIRLAEGSTSGEIYCVVARSSDSYFYPAAFALTGGMLLASLVVAFMVDAWWIALQPSLFVSAQVLALAAALLVIWIFPALRIHFVPRTLRYRRAHQNAVKQFVARNVHVTQARTGVLIFVSLAERYAEVVADAGINQHVAQNTWNEIVEKLIDHARRGMLADGFVAAVAEVGVLLGTHFPPQADNPNELDDHLIEL